MSRRLLVVMALLAALPSRALARDGEVSVVFDPGASLYCSTIPCACWQTAYVFAFFTGASQTGITGVEYAVTPSNGGTGYTFIETFQAPTVVGLGAFPPHGGVNVAWPACQTGDWTKLLIETVRILNVSDCSGDEVVLTVTKKYQASNQFFQCPLFILCDAPIYTKVCLGSNVTTCQNPEPPYPDNALCSTSGRAFLNPQYPYCHDVLPASVCPVAAKPQAWSAVKQLYRD